MSNNLEAVFRRLKKLFAVAEDGRGDPAEAAAAAAMAEKIMRTYQIEQGDLFVDETTGADAFAEWDVGGTEDMMPARPMRIIEKWAGRLCVAVAKLNDCQAVMGPFDKLMGKTIRFRGLKSDVEMCKFTYKMVVNNMNMQVKRLKPEFPKSFRTGYAHEVCLSLGRALEEKKREMQGAANSRALVVVKENAVIKHYGEVKYGTSQVDAKDASSYNQGREEGRKLNPTMRGVSSTTNPTKVLQ